MSDLASTWCAFGLMIVVIGGAGWLVVTQISDTYPVLFSEVQKTADQLQRSLAGPPFHLNASRLSKLSTDILNYISQHKSVVAGTVLTGGKYALEFLAGIVLTLFISFFLIKDGRRIWRFLISGMRPEARRRAANAGDAGWRALVHYIRGTTVVAAIHALFIGLALWLLGVPLLVPLIVLVFLAAFIPIIGILVVGALAILVALATKGWVAAVILLGVFLLENQIESHLLQPLVMGRIIRLHPLAIILVLAVGGIIAGIPGAIIAVPVAAVITYAWPELRNGQPPS
jgi:predicted PurR-regulated permease PerM